jgi:hypothetical protein
VDCAEFGVSVAGSVSGGCSWGGSDLDPYFAWSIATGPLTDSNVSVTIPSAYLQTPSASGTYTDGWIRNVLDGTHYPYSVTITDSPDPSEPTPERVLPADVVQEFGFPPSGTCDAAAPEGLNWAGVPNGGWARSWGQWMNEGRGGAVCTRTLYYAASKEAWAVR